MIDPDITNEDEEIEVEAVRDGEVVPRDAEDKIKRMKTEIDRIEKERKEYLDGWQRAKADFINYKRDEGKRLEDMARFIAAGLTQDLLPILDSFDLGLRSFRQTAGGAQADDRGILLIRSQLMDVLKKRGVEEIAVKPGDNFNPENHESIGEMESDLPVGVVAEEVQKGYLLNGRVLRPSRVRIAKSK